jgi:hypothetical protein
MSQTKDGILSSQFEFIARRYPDLYICAGFISKREALKWGYLLFARRVVGPPLGEGFSPEEVFADAAKNLGWKPEGECGAS